MDVAPEGDLIPLAHDDAVRIDGDDGALETCGERATVTPAKPGHLPPTRSCPHRNARRTGSRAGVGLDRDHKRRFLRDTASTHAADVLARVSGGESDQSQVGTRDLQGSGGGSSC